MTKRLVGGYVYRQEVSRARMAVNAAREALRRLVQENPGSQTRAMLETRLALNLAEALDALYEIERIEQEK